MLRTQVDVDGDAVKIEIQYPDSFPWTRFTVFAPELRLPRHQHPFNRNLCVFPRGSAHWRPKLTAADVVAERVPDLIRLVRQGGAALAAAEEPQGEPYSDYYEYLPTGAFLIPQEIIDAASGVDGGQFVVQMAAADDWMTGEVQRGGRTVTGNGVVVELRRGQKVLATAPAEIIAALEGPKITGRWVRRRTAPAGPTASEVLADVAADLTEAARPESKHWQLVGVAFGEEVRLGEIGDAWVFAAVRDATTAKPGAPRPRETTRQSTGLIRGVRCGLTQLTDRIPELAALREHTASVIGLGSLGAPLATELARGTIRNLRIADYDFVDPGTAVRWDAGIAAAGGAKPLVVAHRLRRHYPYTAVDAHAVAIGHPLGDAQQLSALLDGADLVIEATAEDNVTAAVAHRAALAGLPLITVWSIEGAGGVVARIVPGETGCYHCLLLHTSGEADATIALPKPYGAAPVQPRGCADPTFTATSVDLRPLVDQAARLAFGELCRGIPGGYPRHTSDVQALFLREADGSLCEPLRWAAHSLPIHPRCTLHDVG